MSEEAASRIGDTVFESRGDGPAVVLVHGLGMTRRMWDWQWPALTRHFGVVRYDLLGHGESARPRDPYSLGRFVDQIESLMSGLGVERGALVGFSLGGLIVRAFTLAHPARVSALVVLNSPHDRSDAERQAVLARVEQTARGGPQATVEASLRRWFTDDFAARRPDIVDVVRQWTVSNDREVYPLIYRVLAEGDRELSQAVSAIRCPTLVVTTGDDQGNSPEMARRLASLIPDAQLEIVPLLRHMGLVEDPEPFNARLVAFLGEALGASPSRS